MTTPARDRVTDFWDDHIRRWLDGDDSLPDRLKGWFQSYQGSGAGTVTREGFPEPYLGDLAGHTATPAIVVLGLNPGQYQPHFQARSGLFANQIREAGAYSRWAATGPYASTSWTSVMGPNRFHSARLRFARDWLDRPALNLPELVIFECYPWHSTAVTAPMKPAIDVIESFVWQPIAEVPVREVFAFGRPWAHVADALGLPIIDKLGAGGRPYGSAVPSRAVRVHELASGQRLVVEWHSGGAGPPNTAETRLLRQELAV